VRAGVLYHAYKRWAEASGEYVQTGTAFGRKLTERGFEKREGMTGVVRYGLALLDEDAQENQQGRMPYRDDG
jgi:phage/plasmid-associated DNA primase